MKRRNFVKSSVIGATAAATLSGVVNTDLSGCIGSEENTATSCKSTELRKFNSAYQGSYLNRVAFPMGGIGAGMICLEGTGALSHVSLRHHPDVFNEPCTFSAICVKGEENIARVIEGPVPKWKAFGPPDSCYGQASKTWGLPRFAECSFETRFPFGIIKLRDKKIPLEVTLTGWSPFIPGDADNSSLPVAALEYTFKNTSNKTVEAVFSFNSRNLMEPKDRHYRAVKNHLTNVTRTEGGFTLNRGAAKDAPWTEGSFCASIAEDGTSVNCRWFRGGWWDPWTMAWNDVVAGATVEKPPFSENEMPSPGGSIFLPFNLAPGEKKTITLQLSWYVPCSDVREGPEVEYETENNKACCPEAKPGQDNAACLTKRDSDLCDKGYRPWYASKFSDIEAIRHYWKENYQSLKEKSELFSDCFYETSLPPEVVEAVAANLTILKSPTVMRTINGRLWAYEGCLDEKGCCYGSCTHVWNYAQAICHLFPELERSLRETELFVNQSDDGRQSFRTSLPIRTPDFNFEDAACDGQLGGVMKAYREWRISGNKQWIKKLWPRIEKSLSYSIQRWDPAHKGILEEPHHNTYDIKFWGPDGMCTIFYLGALKAATLIGKALNKDVSLYSSLYKKGRAYLEKNLFNSEYFFQKVQWEGLKTKFDLKPKDWDEHNSPETIELTKLKGPKYQYGTGCISDGVMGVWLAYVCGIGEILDPEKVKSNLKSIHQYNFRENLTEHTNPQRPSFAFGDDGGLLLCTWPKGGKPILPFVYSDEVWTGIEYQVASHLMSVGLVDESLEIVRTLRNRYDGTVRNPFNEYECGHWYARAMASYALLQGLSGARYDAVEKTLYLEPSVEDDFKCFFSTATGYGLVGVKNGKPFLEVKQGEIKVKRIKYTPKLNKQGSVSDLPPKNESS
jgi:uncharacterized protein (DUF608 family)